jgi:hypothetical protein
VIEEGPMRALTLLATLLLLVAAAPPRKEEKPRPAEVKKEGKLLVVRGLSGGEPQLTADDGGRYLVTGVWREELLRLEGHKVRLWATPGPKKLMMPTLDASRYEILDSGGGRRPLVGTLRSRSAGGLALERPKEATLDVEAPSALRAELAKRVGCKVWLVGDLEGTTIKAFKYGWLSCKPPKAIKTDKTEKPEKIEKETKP